MSGQAYKADGRSSLQIKLVTGSGVDWSTVGSGSGWLAELRPSGSPTVTNASATFNITVAGDTMTLTLDDPSPLLHGPKSSYGWALYDGAGAPILTDMVVELHDGYTHPSGSPSPSAATEVGTYVVDLGTAVGNLTTVTVWTGPQGPAGPAGAAVNINDASTATTSTFSSSKITNDYAALLPAQGSYSYNADGTVASDPAGVAYTYNTDGTVHTEAKGGVTRTYTYNTDGTIASVA